MWIIVPTYIDYRESAEKIQSFLWEHWLEYCMYGSFLIQEKVRLWLSDIDIFVIDPANESFIFPIGISELFWHIKKEISNLWIQIQVNWTTLWQLKNNFLSPDNAYLEEVNRGTRTPYVSHNFSSYLNQTESRLGNLDDENMARYFHRKIIGIWVDISDMIEILEKNEEELNKNDQKELWKFWDNFKKNISFMGVLLRKKTWKSLFHLKNRDLFDRFCQEFDINPNDLENYLKLLESIKNIHDWYAFLKKNWITQIIYIYRNVFHRIFDAIKKL